MNVSLLLSKWGRRVGKDISKFRNKAPAEPVTNRWNIVKGDAVEVIQGPQTGKRGKVLDVIRKANRIIVEGVNMVCYRFAAIFSLTENLILFSEIAMLSQT